MSINSVYYKNLIEAVLGLSEADNWKSDVVEWNIDDAEEDETKIESCACGKENIRYLFTIRNTINGNNLYPIGSSCIKKFERADLNEEVTAKEQLFKFLHAIEDNSYLTLSSEFFSRELLLNLYHMGAFKATPYNGFEPYNDYKFLLDMFNKRRRTANQDKKATAIILSSVKPFLQEMFKDKVRKKRCANIISDSPK